jgi:hypothetical protein
MSRRLSTISWQTTCSSHKSPADKVIRSQLLCPSTTRRRSSRNSTLGAIRSTTNADMDPVCKMILKSRRELNFSKRSELRRLQLESSILWHLQTMTQALLCMHGVLEATAGLEIIRATLKLHPNLSFLRNQVQRLGLSLTSFILMPSRTKKLSKLSVASLTTCS